VTTWIILGSSPLARQAYATARQMAPDTPVITCNQGLSIEPDPDFYFLSDCKACTLFSRDGKAASKRNGRTKTVTLRRDAHAMKMRTVDDFDLVVREGHPYEPFQLSGLWCTEFAIRFGYATRLLLCGMDGYNPEIGVGDYAEGLPLVDCKHGPGKDLTATVIIPLSTRIASKYPQVHFLQIGAPCYRIEKANWEVVSP
jgi:hypothetical protein